MTVENTHNTPEADVDALARERAALTLALAQSNDDDVVTSERLAQVEGLLLSTPCQGAAHAALALSLVAQGFASGWRTDRAEARALDSVRAYLAREAARQAADADLLATGAQYQAALAKVALVDEACVRGEAGEEVADAACAELFALEDRLLAAQASTPAGWQAKARVVAHLIGTEPDGTYEDAATRNLLADMQRAGA